MSNYFSRFKMASCPFEVRWLFGPKPDRNLPLWSQKWKENMLQNIRLQRNSRSPRSDNNMNDSCVKIYLYLEGREREISFIHADFFVPPTVVYLLEPEPEVNSSNVTDDILWDVRVGNSMWSKRWTRRLKLVVVIVDTV